MSFINVDIILKQNIILTGDIHQNDLNGSDSVYLDKYTEVDLTEKYLSIANRFDITPILFLTGRCVKNEWHKILDLKTKYNFCIGGHTYYANKPKILYKFFNKIGNKNGPYYYQKMDVNKTINVIKEKLKININIWRNHGYREDKNTSTILKELGIKYKSNKCNLDLLGIYKNKGIFEIPINTLPDHENLDHSTDHKNGISINKWFKIVKYQIEQKLLNNGQSILLVHPACMWIEDQFESFENLCELINQYNI